MTGGLRVETIRENVRVYSLGGESIATSYGANCTAIAGRAAVLLVDPLIAPAYARQIEEAVASWTPLPIRFVVLTHHHTDHALGAGYFAAKGAAVLAHTACRDRMEAEHANLIESRRQRPDLAPLFADAKAYSPTLVFEKDFAFDLGETVARVVHPGPGHTPGDAFVYLETESLVVCGDLVSSFYHVNYEDASIENLEHGLEELRTLSARTYVPGHGLAGDSRLLDAQLRYHCAIRDAAKEEIEEPKALKKLRGLFPVFLLEEVLPTGLRAFSTSSQPARPSRT
jgi:cyclase